MKFSRVDANVFAPDGSSAKEALKRTTHLCIAAHQDDIEIMAHAGIAACYDRHDRHFTGVMLTNGAGSPRTGAYASIGDEEMQRLRQDEQRRAATLGKYNLMLQLSHPSAALKSPSVAGVREDLTAILDRCTPEVVYIHNPADKHDTHVAATLRCLDAMRSFPAHRRPKKVLGCEVWRDLDWLVDGDKSALDASEHPALAAALLQAFDSQIGGGKRYDLATLGRRAANATFHTAHATDQANAITWAMDLTPLVADETLSVRDYTLGHVDRLRADIAARVEKFTG